MQEGSPGVRCTTLCLAEPDPGPRAGSPAPGALEAEEEEQTQQLVTALRSLCTFGQETRPRLLGGHAEKSNSSF